MGLVQNVLRTVQGVSNIQTLPEPRQYIARPVHLLGKDAYRYQERTYLCWQLVAQLEQCESHHLHQVVDTANESQPLQPRWAHKGCEVLLWRQRKTDLSAPA